MALTIGELTAYLRLDDSDYQAGVKRATSTWGTLSNSLTTGAKAAAIGLGVAAAGAVTLTVSLARTGAAYNSLQQNSRAALTAIMGGAEQANAQMDKLDEFARTSPFSKSVFITAQQQLLGFGMQADKVLPTLDAIQQAVAATGGSSQQVGDLAFILAQVSAAGKVTGQDLLQLGQRGVDAATMVGTQMGVTGAEVRQMITAGTLGADDFLSMLTTGMSERFAGATANVKAQWSGAEDRIKAGARDIGATIAKPFIDPQGGGQLVVWGNSFADILSEAQKKLAELMSLIDGRAAPGFRAITMALDGMRDAVGSINVNNIVKGWDKLKDYAPLVSGMAGSVVGLNASLLAGVPVVGRFAAVLNPVVLGLGALIAASPQARAAVANFVQALAPAGESLQEVGLKAANLGMAIISDLTPGLTAILGVVANLVVAFAPIAPSLVDVLTAAEPVVGVVSSLLQAVAELPAPVIAAAAAMVLFSRAVPAEAILSGLAGAARKAGSALVDVGLSAAAVGESGMVSLRNGASVGSVAMSGMASAGNAAKGAVGGLLASISPMGWVVGGVTAAFTLWAAIQAENAKRQQDLAQASDEVVDTLGAQDGALTNNTRHWLENKVAKADIGDALEEIGISSNTMVEALMGDKDAIKEYNDAISGTLHDMNVGYGDNAHTIQVYSSAAEDVIAAHSDLNEVMTEAQRKQKENADAMDASAQSAEGLSDSLKKARQAQDDLRAANMNLSDSLDRQGDLYDRAQELAGKYGQQVADASGHFDSSTAAGREYNGALSDMAANYSTVLDNMEKANKSGSELRATAADQRAEFLAVAATFGVTGEAAEALADKYLAIPADVHTTAELEVAGALKSKDDLVAQIDASAGTVSINGNNVPGTLTLGELLGNVDSASGTVDINGNQFPADQTLYDYLGIVNNSDGTVSINGQDPDARYTLAQLQLQIDATTGNVKIGAVDNASTTLSNIKGTLDSIQSKSVTVTATYISVGSSAATMYATAQADGGYIGPNSIHRYAANGLSSRQAMYAPGGSWITWAEDETQGEYYIPAAWSKRRRSTMLLSQAASDFGLALVPKAAKAYANGSSASMVQEPYSGVNMRDVIRDAISGARIDLDAGGAILSGYVRTIVDGEIDRNVADMRGRRI